MESVEISQLFTPRDVNNIFTNLINDIIIYILSFLQDVDINKLALLDVSNYLFYSKFRILNQNTIYDFLINKTFRNKILNEANYKYLLANVKTIVLSNLAMNFPNISEIKHFENLNGLIFISNFNKTIYLNELNIICSISKLKVLCFFF